MLALLLAADVFVTQQVALLREKPAPTARIVRRLDAGTRGTLVARGTGFLKVSIAGTLGFLAEGVASTFDDGCDGSREMVVVGRFLAGDSSRRALAVSLLLRGTERLRADGMPDPDAEILLGETAETLIATSDRVPEGIGVVFRARRRAYDGEAFRRTLLTRDSDRARAGALRSEFPGVSDGFIALWKETGAFLSLSENATDPKVIAFATDRLGTASLALGRLLLAAGHLDELERLEARVTDTAARTGSAKLGARTAILLAMRGNGRLPFPQETEASQTRVRLEGEIGALSLRVNGSSVPAAAIPVLPVPGSLRVAPDGKTAAWLEVSSPTTITPVVVSLSRDDPARNAARLSGGRPTRDLRKMHTLTSLLDFSKDGQRLAVAITAWDDVPATRPRLAVLSTATGELVVEARGDRRGRARVRKAL
jgi:hypothetical protein